MKAFRKLRDWAYAMDKKLTKGDWILFGVIALFCFLCYAQEDILLTSARGILLWDSHLTDYYDVMYNWSHSNGANYMPTIFWLFGLWSLPLRIFGVHADTIRFGAEVNWATIGAVLWMKLLPLLFFVMSCVVFRKIALLVTGNEDKAKATLFSFITMPFLLYSQFIFSQYEIIGVFFMLMGIWFYLRDRKGDLWWFALFFGLAVTTKYYAVLIFAVLLLLREKRVRKLIGYGIMAVVPFAAEFLLYFRSEHFRESVFGFKALDFISQGDIVTTIGGISLVSALCVGIVVAAYMIDPKDRREETGWWLFLTSGICFAMFGLMSWNPQWLLFGVPFWVLSAAVSRNEKKFLWLDIVMMFMFLTFVADYVHWIGNCDDAVLMYGVFGPVLKGNLTHHMNQFMLPKLSGIYYSALVACFFCMFFFKHPKYRTAEGQEAGIENVWLMRARLILTFLYFTGPAFLSFILNVRG